MCLLPVSKVITAKTDCQLWFVTCICTGKAEYCRYDVESFKTYIPYLEIIAFTFHLSPVLCFSSGQRNLLSRVQITLHGRSDLQYLVDGVSDVTGSVQSLPVDEPGEFSPNDNVVFTRSGNETVVNFINGVGIRLQAIVGQRTSLLAASYVGECIVRNTSMTTFMHT